MIEVREMKTGEEAQLMDFLQTHVTMRLSIDQKDRIFLFLDGDCIHGFLEVRPVSQTVCQLMYLETTEDNPVIQDGLLRTVLHALCRKNVTWVVVDTDFHSQLLVLQEVFSPALETLAFLAIMKESGVTFQVQNILVTQPDVIFRGTCRGGS